jgi:type VI secretion system secreted protein VgrG
VVTGDIGVSPGGPVPYTNTGCSIAGATPPATNAAAAQARPAFLSAYAALQPAACILVSGSLAARTLPPGVYCLDAAAKTGTLTLSGRADGVWVFRAPGAITGTNFSVVMAGGADACNVFWAPSAGVTMTTSAMKGNILAGNAAAGSVTLTGGTLTGRAFAHQAVTMTTVGVMGCSALANPTPPPKDHGHGGHNSSQSVIPF